MNYKFSIVIPIYNVEEYLEDTILSVINQTIGFEENIQMILVNDGSPDNSEDICMKYLHKYPNNIEYIKQENTGVSSARNNGLKYAKGKYINFLDSDDKWEVDAFEKVYNFFEQNEDKIDVVACELEYFEAKTGLSHPLNFKFNKDKIVDVKFAPEEIQMHMASCFIKKDSINVLFNTNLKFGEDALFINQIILQKHFYGVLNSVHYMYRKRLTESSAIDTCQLKKDFYEKTLINFHNELINYCKNNYNKVLPYIQYILMYDLQWRIKREIPSDVLDKKESISYINQLKSILKNIEDYVIIKQRNINLEHKIYALNLKYETDITKELVQIKNDFMFHNLLLFSSKNKSFARLSEISIKNDIVHLEGIINTPISSSEYQIILMDQNSNSYGLKLIDYKKQEKVNVEGHFYYNQYFKVDIPLINNQILKLKFLLKYQDECPIILDIGNTSTCRINTSIKGGFLKLKNNIIEYKKCQLIIRNNSKKLHFCLEKKYNHSLWQKGYKRLVVFRWLRFILYYLIKKDIWLISDRPNKAGDNGEAFFNYLQTINNKNIKTYFVIDKNSEDYHKLKKMGKVLKFNSFYYKLLFLLSSKIISSQASEYIINPFEKDFNYIKDLYTFDFIFLQHGVTKDDLSNWLNKESKKIDLFVTAGIPEYNSIVNGDYYYDKNIVKLVGFPRYDNLIQMNKKTNQIAIVPTWRKYIPNCVDVKIDKSIYNENFKESNFFKFYNSLINDEKLINTMKKYNYSGIFCLHPLFSEQYKHFDENDTIKVNKGYVNYQRLFAENDLLVTDYSSLFFDFAYLNKPVVYCHFDIEEFFTSHSYNKGYFSYEKNGFGPISYSLEETVENIIKMIENDCKLSEKYKQRIDEFYPIERGNNSKNLYNEIIKM